MAREIVGTHTEVASPYLCPEVRLHLITSSCPLWTATEAEAAAAGLVDPYWAFAWAGGQALARYLLDHPEVVRGRTVLDFGAGGGVEAVAAAICGGQVTVADVDPVAVAAAHMNAELNRVTVESTTEDLVGRVDLDQEVILAGDVCYERPFAGRVVAWLRALAGAGRTVLLADPGRGFLEPDGLSPLCTLLAPADVDADGTRLVDTTIYAVRP